MSTMNLTIEQATSLLNQLGVVANVVKEESEATEGVNVEEIIKAIHKSEPDTIGFTEEQVGAKVSAAVGKLYGTIRSALGSQFGVKNSELEGLEAKDLASKLREVSNSRYSAKEQELAGQVEELTRQLNSKDEEFSTKYSDIEKTWQAKLSKRDILEKAIKELGKIPRRGGDTSAQAEVAVQRWENMYDLQYNPSTGEIDFYVKGTEDLVMDGANPIRADKLGKEFISTMGLDVESTAHISPATIENNKGDMPSNQGMGVPRNARAVNPKFANLEAQIARGEGQL